MLCRFLCLWYIGLCSVFKIDAKKIIRPVKNFGLVDSALISVEKEMGYIGHIGAFITNELLFIAKGALYPKGKLFNLMSPTPAASAFLIIDEEGEHKKVRVELDNKHKLNLIQLLANHEGTFILGVDAAGSVAVWVKKPIPPNEKKIDYVFKIKEIRKITKDSIKEIRLATDDEHIALLAKNSYEVRLWVNSFSEKPGIFKNPFKIGSVDFHPLATDNFIIGDSVGRILFVRPKFPNVFTNELLIEDSIRLIGHPPVTHLYYTPSGEHIIALTKNDDMFIIPYKKRRQYTRIKKIHRGFSGLSFLKEANFFVTAGRDSTVKLWSMEFSDSLFTFKRPNAITDISASNKENIFLSFDNKDSVTQYYFNNYMLNALFIYYNLNRDINNYMQKWRHKRATASIKTFIQLSNKKTIKSQIKKLIEEGLSRYIGMALYKNLVSIKSEGYDAKNKALICSMDGFEYPFKVKISEKDTNFFKITIKDDLVVSQVEGLLSANGGLIFNKGHLDIKEKSFDIIPNQDHDPLEDTLHFGFNVDSSLGIYLSSFKKLKIDSLLLAEHLFKSDVDTIKIPYEKKRIANKKKALFIGIGIDNNKESLNPFGSSDLKSISNYIKGIFAIPKARTLLYTNPNKQQLLKALNIPKINALIQKNKVSEIFIFISGISHYNPANAQDYLIGGGSSASYTNNGIAWEELLKSLEALSVSKINLFIDSDIKDKSFFNRSSNYNVIVSNGYAQKANYDRKLFHSFFTYALLKSLQEREKADKNKNKSLTYYELSDYMDKIVQKESQQAVGAIQRILFYGNGKRTFLSYKPVSLPLSPASKSNSTPEPAIKENKTEKPKPTPGKQRP